MIRILSRSKSRSAGFTLFELIIVIILVAVFAGVLLGRFQMYQEAAEKAAMEQTAGAIRSALNIQLAALIARGRAGDIPRLAALNPVTLLAEKQRNYVGEYYDVAGSDIAPGSWYYDLKSRQLVYLVDRGTHFVPDKSGRKWVRYRVGLVYNDAVSPAGDASDREIAGITFTEVEPYIWAPR
jgi:prepilin-type N-terminal cleavage/methylation domain-containing protein